MKQAWPKVRFGAAYYHEYQPYDRLQVDIELMLKAGFTTVRVGESTWSTWEPSDSRFETKWMQRILDALQDAGIEAILGTPTYAIPPWLARKHPEVMGVRPGGHQIPYGGRQDVDLTHPAYLFHAERVIRTVVSTFADHPAVIGYQLDNETGIELLDNDGVFDSFVEWLRRRYRNVEELNEAWGLTYWSHRLSTWSDLWRPAGNTAPSYDLEWRRFQSEQVTKFIEWQASIVREYARPDQFVTHCLVGGHGRPAADRRSIARLLDVPADNLYYAMQDSLQLPDPPTSGGHGPDWIGAGGVWRLMELADIARSSAHGPFLVTETNAGAIGAAHENYPAYDGQWRMAAYALIARGAVGVGYWHWHTLHQGFEQYWGGVLGHDLQPGRAYGELAQIGAELGRHGAVLAAAQPDADVAVLYSQDSRYAFAMQPPLAAAAGSRRADPHSYERIFDASYRWFFDAGAQIEVVYPGDDLSRFRVVVVPAFYAASDEMLQQLCAYTEAGGHLFVTFRSGYATELVRSRPERAPGPLRPAVGASYQEFSNLVQPLRVTSGDAGLAIPAHARATAWVDGLLLEGAQTLVAYDHPHFGRFPAVTTNVYGSGRVTYVGTLPNPVLGEALARWVLNQAGLSSWISTLPKSIRVCTARTATGGSLYYVFNWSAEKVKTALPIAARDLYGGQEISSASQVALGPWDVRVLATNVVYPDSMVRR